MLARRVVGQPDGLGVGVVELALGRGRARSVIVSVDSPPSPATACSYSIGMRCSAVAASTASVLHLGDVVGEAGDVARPTQKPTAGRRAGAGDAR